MVEWLASTNSRKNYQAKTFLKYYWIAYVPRQSVMDEVFLVKLEQLLAIHPASSTRYRTKYHSRMGEETRYADEVEVNQAYMKWWQIESSHSWNLGEICHIFGRQLGRLYERIIFIIKALLFFSLSKLGCMTCYWSTHWKLWSSRYYLTFCCLNLCDQPTAWFLSFVVACTIVSQLVFILHEFHFLLNTP